MNRRCSGQGRFGRLAALIMEAQLAVFIVTMEGGHGMNGRWYMRCGASCQLAWTSDSVRSLTVSSAGCEIERERDSHSTQHMSSSDLCKVKVFNQWRRTKTGSAADVWKVVEVVGPSYRIRLSRREREEEASWKWRKNAWIEAKGIWPIGVLWCEAILIGLHSLD